MFKLKVQITIDRDIEGRCPRHHYNPLRDPNGFKSGCTVCQQLFHAYDSYRQMREAIEKFDRAIDPFVKVKKTRKRTILSTAATPEPSFQGTL